MPGVDPPGRRPRLERLPLGANPIDLELRALDWLFGTWLPASGFVPAESPGFEAWMGRPFKDGMERFEL